MTAAPSVYHEPSAPGPRYAIDACALAFGPTRGPILLISSRPAWERALRRRLGDRLFAAGDPSRPPAQAWIGAAWLEPQRQTWRANLDEIARELPRGSLLAVIQSLPLALLQTNPNASALGLYPTGTLRLRGALVQHGFRVERTFGFQTIWWIALRRLAVRLSVRRPDLSDRIQFAMRRGFATRDLALSFATIGLIEARAGMRPE